MTSRNAMAVDTAAALGTPIAWSPAVYPASATPIPPGTGMKPANRLTIVFTRISCARVAL